MQIETAIGYFDISMPPAEFVCREEPGVFTEGERIIKSCKTKVIIKFADGREEIFEPVIYQSCMNPDNKTIVPIVYREFDGENNSRKQFSLSTPYKELRTDHISEVKWVKTESFEPSIKKKSCTDCHNCGRC